MKQLFNQSDFLLLQEHGLYRSQFGWFYKIGICGVGTHGVSAMNENELLSARPHGGSVIIWNQNIKAKIDPVEYNSNRACAVAVEIFNKKWFFYFVYICYVMINQLIQILLSMLGF